VVVHARPLRIGGALRPAFRKSLTARLKGATGIVRFGVFCAVRRMAHKKKAAFPPPLSHPLQIDGVAAALHRASRPKT
jgi:hypothetical protein